MTSSNVAVGLDVDTAIQAPRNKEQGIGIIGAGAIVRHAHLPAYHAAGLNVVGLTDLDSAKARELAGQFGIQRVYPDAAALIADPEVAIVDIALPPEAQYDIASRAATAGKHLLCQKPLALTMPVAEEIVDAARSAGVRLAVNQQMRWEPGIRAAKQLLERGWIGEPTFATIRLNIQVDWSAWPWMQRQPRMELFFHSIHHFDSIRYLLGEPEWVTGWLGRNPGQAENGETRSHTRFDYSDTLHAIVSANHNYRADDTEAVFELHGTEGVLKGTLGLLYDYPHGRADTLILHSHRTSPASAYSFALDGRWIPDAFLGPMASLMNAIETGTEPETSGADNLRTLALVLAAYRSAEERCSVRAGIIV